MDVLGRTVDAPTFATNFHPSYLSSTFLSVLSLAISIVEIDDRASSRKRIHPGNKPSIVFLIGNKKINFHHFSPPSITNSSTIHPSVDKRIFSAMEENLIAQVYE